MASEQLGEDEIAGAHSGRNDLRERRRVDHPRAALELVQRRRRDPLEADKPVGVVLEHQEIMLGGQLGEAAASFETKRPPAWVLEGRDYVKERRPRPSSKLFGKGVEVDPFVV